MDARHKKRINIIQNLYAYSFQHSIDSFINVYEPETLNVIRNIKKIDTLIARYATKFPIQKIGKVDLAILRLAVHELIFSSTQPKKVVINEAIELSKELGGEKSFSFINGVLAKIVSKHNGKNE